MSLTSQQRKHLRGLAHGQKPVVHVGKAGLGEGVLEEVERALASHELIKVRIQLPREEKEEACGTIAERLDAERVGMIGHVAIFYRPARDPDERRIKVPA